MRKLIDEKVEITLHMYRRMDNAYSGVASWLEKVYGWLMLFFHFLTKYVCNGLKKENHLFIPSPWHMYNLIEDWIKKKHLNLFNILYLRVLCILTLKFYITFDKRKTISLKSCDNLSYRLIKMIDVESWLMK